MKPLILLIGLACAVLAPLALGLDLLHTIIVAACCGVASMAIADYVDE